MRVRSGLAASVHRQGRCGDLGGAGQNVARAGTEQFRSMCQSECAGFLATAVSADEFESSFPTPDGKLGRYEAWELSFAEEECVSSEGS